MRETNVFELALCRPEHGYDPDLWYPTSDERTARGKADRQAAKAVCARCPAREACARYALEAGEEAGVWGGLSEADRRALRRGRVVADAPPGADPRAA